MKTKSKNKKVKKGILNMCIEIPIIGKKHVLFEHMPKLHGSYIITQGEDYHSTKPDCIKFYFCEQDKDTILEYLSEFDGLNYSIPFTSSIEFGKPYSKGNLVKFL